MPKYILNTGRTPISLTIPQDMRQGKETRVHFPSAMGAIDTGLPGDEKYEVVPAKFFVEVDRELVKRWVSSSPAYFEGDMLRIFDERPSKTTIAEPAKATITNDDLTAKSEELTAQEAALAEREQQAKLAELKVLSDEAVLALEKAELALEKVKDGDDKDAIKEAEAEVKKAKTAATKAMKAHEEAAKAAEEDGK